MFSLDGLITVVNDWLGWVLVIVAGFGVGEANISYLFKQKSKPEPRPASSHPPR